MSMFGKVIIIQNCVLYTSAYYTQLGNYEHEQDLIPFDMNATGADWSFYHWQHFDFFGKQNSENDLIVNIFIRTVDSIFVDFVTTFWTL